MNIHIVQRRVGQRVRLQNDEHVDEDDIDPDLRNEVEIQFTARDIQSSAKSRQTISRKSSRKSEAENSIPSSRIVKSRGRPIKPHEVRLNYVVALFNKFSLILGLVVTSRCNYCSCHLGKKLCKMRKRIFERAEAIHYSHYGHVNKNPYLHSGLTNKHQEVWRGHKKWHEHILMLFCHLNV